MRYLISGAAGYVLCVVTVTLYCVYRYLQEIRHG